MKTEIDPRPITSFDDLIRITEADAEMLATPESSPIWQKILAILLWVPVLLVIAAVTILVCSLYWWNRYGDEVAQGLLLLLKIFTEGSMYT